MLSEQVGAFLLAPTVREREREHAGDLWLRYARAGAPDVDARYLRVAAMRARWERLRRAAAEPVACPLESVAEPVQPEQEPDERAEELSSLRSQLDALLSESPEWFQDRARRYVWAVASMGRAGNGLPTPPGWTKEQAYRMRRTLAQLVRGERDPRRPMAER